MLKSKSAIFLSFKLLLGKTMIKSKKQEKTFFLIYDINELITKW
nr:MAG TPA: hypothetical protein [Caudoviricetes sp.]